MSRHPHRPTNPTRRDVLRGGTAASLGVLLGGDAIASVSAWFGATDAVNRDRPYLDTARRSAAWLRATAITDERGTRWPADPNDPKSVSLDLYNGTTGVIPFWLELHHATGDREALALAASGADYLVGTLPEGKIEDAGLYTGVAGVGWVLAMVHRATGAAKYGDAAARALELLKGAATPTGAGVAWSDSTDVISGSAGIGLYLLWAHAARIDPAVLELAARAGRRLIEVGVADKGGVKWMISPEVPRNYPNFSHGTAGVSYFLATLHQATGEKAFLDAATAGATYLEALATTTPNGGRMVFHSEPGNEQIFYLSWCHGPGGTARLFHRLGQITGEADRSAWVDHLATAVVDMQVPEQSPGYWNNISQCCGNCGVTEFFVDLHHEHPDRGRLAFAEQVARNTISRGTPEGDGMKWIQAEHRVKPELLVAQTGLMQGAAGVGLAMLHLDGALAKRQRFVALPDNPFVVGTAG